MTCSGCGAEIRIGEWPYCPHGFGANAIQDVTWPGGKVFENLGDQPVRCDSPADLKRELKARNLEPFVRNAGPDDKHAGTWSSMSQVTLDGAKAMLERIATAKSTQTTVPDYISSMTVTVTEESGTVYAQRGTFGTR